MGRSLYATWIVLLSVPVFVVMKILKFGGSSLRDSSRISSVLEIVKREGEARALVVSAMEGVTDLLARAGDEDLGESRALLQEAEQRHLKVVDLKALRAERAGLRTQIGSLFRELRSILYGVSLVGECTARTRDLVSSYGERISSIVVSAALRGAGIEATACDSRRFVVTDDRFGCAQIDLKSTFEQVRRHFDRNPGLQVVPGFIGSTRRGETTTLGRGGSDHTATLIGAALGADAIEIWSDVDGVMSADPRLVPGAFSIPRLSYVELMELSHFGAKVVYPPAIQPARAEAIPLRIKNTLNPRFPGTLVLEQAPPSPFLIRAISSINQIALMRLEGDGMVGIPGIAARLFGALASSGIGVVLISQASSEHSICFAVSLETVPIARKRLEEEFRLERDAGLIDELVVEEDLSIIAAVGEEMRERPGIAGRIFKVLGDEGINIRAIAQGSSELNISLVVKRVDEGRALGAIHNSFFSREHPGGQTS